MGFQGQAVTELESQVTVRLPKGDGSAGDLRREVGLSTLNRHGTQGLATPEGNREALRLFSAC